jgi:hypothetical protein
VGQGKEVTVLEACMRQSTILLQMRRFHWPLSIARPRHVSVVYSEAHLDIGNIRPIVNAKEIMFYAGMECEEVTSLQTDFFASSSQSSIVGWFAR